MATTSGGPITSGANTVVQPKRRGRRRQQVITEQPNGLDRVFIWDLDGSLMRAGLIGEANKAPASEPSVLASVNDKLSSLAKRFKQQTLHFCEQNLHLNELEPADQMHIDDVSNEHHQTTGGQQQAASNQNSTAARQQQHLAVSEADSASKSRRSPAAQRFALPPATDASMSETMLNNSSAAQRESSTASDLTPPLSDNSLVIINGGGSSTHDSASSLVQHLETISYGEEQYTYPQYTSLTSSASSYNHCEQHPAPAPSSQLADSPAFAYGDQHHYETTSNGTNHNINASSNNSNSNGSNNNTSASSTQSHELATCQSQTGNSFHQLTNAGGQMLLLAGQEPPGADEQQQQQEVNGNMGAMYESAPSESQNDMTMLAYHNNGQHHYGHHYHASAAAAAAAGSQQHLLVAHHAPAAAPVGAHHIQEHQTHLHQQAQHHSHLGLAHHTLHQLSDAHYYHHHHHHHHQDHHQHHLHAGQNHHQHQHHLNHHQQHHFNHLAHPSHQQMAATMHQHHLDMHHLHHPHHHSAYHAAGHLNYATAAAAAAAAAHQHHQQDHQCQQQQTLHDFDRGVEEPSQLEARQQSHKNNQQSSPIIHHPQQQQHQQQHQQAMLLDHQHHGYHQQQFQEDPRHQQQHLQQQQHHQAMLLDHQHHVYHQQQFQEDPRQQAQQHNHHHHDQHHQHLHQLDHNHNHQEPLDIKPQLNSSVPVINSYEIEQAQQPQQQPTEAVQAFERMDLMAEPAERLRQVEHEAKVARSQVAQQNTNGHHLQNHCVGHAKSANTLRTYLDNHNKHQTQKLSVRFNRLKTAYSQFRGETNGTTQQDNGQQPLPVLEDSREQKLTIKSVVISDSLLDILDEIDHYTLDWRKHAINCLKLISSSQNCTNIVITRMPLVIALGHLICLGLSPFFDIDQIYSATKTSKEACIKRVKKRFGATNRCSYIVVGDKDDSDLAKRLDLPCWTTSWSDGHRQLIQLHTALKEGFLM